MWSPSVQEEWSDCSEPAGGWPVRSPYRRWLVVATCRRTDCNATNTWTGNMWVASLNVHNIHYNTTERSVIPSSHYNTTERSVIPSCHYNTTGRSVIPSSKQKCQNPYTGHVVYVDIVCISIKVTKLIFLQLKTLCVNVLNDQAIT